MKKVVAAHDVGRAINPKAIEGQIEGAIAMGLGYALREDFPLDKGIPQGYMEHWNCSALPKCLRLNASSLRKIHHHSAHKAKGVGEIATIPVAPVASAYYRYAKSWQK